MPEEVLHEGLAVDEVHDAREAPAQRGGVFAVELVDDGVERVAAGAVDDGLSVRRAGDQEHPARQPGDAVRVDVGGREALVGGLKGGLAVLVDEDARHLPWRALDAGGGEPRADGQLDARADDGHVGGRLVRAPLPVEAVTGQRAPAVPVEAVPIEAGPNEAGPIEAGPNEAGPIEAGPIEAGPIEAGPIEAGPIGPIGLVDAGLLGPGLVDAGAGGRALVRRADGAHGRASSASITAWARAASSGAPRSWSTT